MKRLSVFFLSSFFLLSGCVGAYVHDGIHNPPQDEMVGLGTFGPDKTFQHDDGSCLKIYQTTPNRVLQFISLGLINFHHTDLEKKCK